MLNFMVLAIGAWVPTNVLSFRVPRPIATLLASSQTHEVERGMYTMNSLNSISNAHRFTSLMKSTHASQAQRATASPQCLSSGSSPEFLSYDSTCANSITPSEYCCQVYAEQACPDPRLTFQQATAMVNERTADFNGLSDKYHYDTCMETTCQSSCSLAEGSDAECKLCANVCQRSCLANMLLLCLRRTCGQSIMSVAEKAINKRGNSPNLGLVNKTDEIVSRKLRIPRNDVAIVEKSLIIDFAISTMQADQNVPLCADNSLVSADVSAGVSVDRAGTTFASALISCTSQILKPSRLSSLLVEPNILGKSDECNVIATCERNHVKLALDRAEYQVTVINSHRNQVTQGAY